MKKQMMMAALLAVSMGITGNRISVNAEEPPAMPDGSQPGGTPPEGTPPEGGMPGEGGQSTVTEWNSVYDYSEDTVLDASVLGSTGTDENVILVNGGTTTLTNAVITRVNNSSTGGDNASFYGVGAALLVTDGTMNVSGGSITTDAKGAAGVFAYGDGTAYVTDTVIRTSQDTSGGIHVAGGGTLYAYDLDVETEGGSSAAIRSDRGGGTMVVEGGRYVSNGSGSPAVYVTADIRISDAELIANGSEAICIEGLNSLELNNVDLTGNMPDDEQNDHTWTVILYQSMSGDSEIGNSSFSMVGGSITSRNGGRFYSTNTESTFYLEDVDITACEDSEYFLRVSGNANRRGWGSTGANGAQTVFTAVSQEINGDVIWDSISTLDLYLSDESAFTGAVIDDESYAGNGGDGYMNLYISSDSCWIVTGDSTLSNLYSEGLIADQAGNAVTIRDTAGNVIVEGTSDYTITVNSYVAEADFSEAAEAPETEEETAAITIEDSGSLIGSLIEAIQKVH